MNIVDKIKEKLLKFHKWNQKSWLLVSVFISTTSIWFSLILNFFGERLHLLYSNENGRSLTVLGIILTVIVVTFSFMVVVAQRYYEYVELNNDANQSELDTITTVSQLTNELCDMKYSKLIKEVFEVKEGIRKIPEVITDPSEQIKHILKNLHNCLCKLLSYEGHEVNKNDMYICLHYNFPKEDSKWYLAESFFSERNINTEELIEGASTFRDLLNSKSDFVFYNSKEEAKRLGKYSEDDQDLVDDNNNLKGSIACYKILIKYKDDIYITAILSFVTYSTKFVNGDDATKIENTKYNIRRSILIPFKERLSIELCLLYLSKMQEVKVSV